MLVVCADGGITFCWYSTSVVVCGIGGTRWTVGAHMVHNVLVCRTQNSFFTGGASIAVSTRACKVVDSISAGATV